MDTPGFKNAYASVLESFVASREEQYLSKAADLGSAMVRAGVPPEDIAEIHEEALSRLAEKAADKTLLEFIQRISAPLMEMLMAYGLAFREREDERTRAVEALRDSEEKLRSVLESSPDGIMASDLYGDIIECNQATIRMHGFLTREELIGKKALDLIVPEERQRATENMERTLREGFTKNEEYVLLRKDGSEFFGEISASVVRDACGSAVSFVVATKDITERKRAQEQLEASHGRLEHMLQGMIHVTERMTETRDPYTSGHQTRVAELSTAIARHLGLPEETCVSLVDMAARIHDIGKTAVPAEILAKPGKLTDAEFALIKIHPQVGYDILKSAELPYPVAEAVLQHHERLDGSGYPQGLSGDDILPEAQILAVADVVEAMSSHRPYRPALGTEVALEEVSSGSGIRYDPDVVEACLAVFRQEGFTFSSLSTA